MCYLFLKYKYQEKHYNQSGAMKMSFKRTIQLKCTGGEKCNSFKVKCLPYACGGGTKLQICFQSPVRVLRCGYLPLRIWETEQPGCSMNNVLIKHQTPNNSVMIIKVYVG